MWFTASLLFSAERSATPDREPLWEEQIVLFQAPDESSAEAKASEHGKAQGHEYTNDAGEVVRWVFKKVERVHPIDSPTLEEGTELFCRFLRDSEVKSLLIPFSD
jgi:hypothetical protein